MQIGLQFFMTQGGNELGLLMAAATLAFAAESSCSICSCSGRIFRNPSLKIRYPFDERYI